MQTLTLVKIIQARRIVQNAQLTSIIKLKTMNQYLTIDDNSVFLWLGHPKSPTSSKIDVTMAFKIGLAIGSKEYDKIEHISL